MTDESQVEKAVQAAVEDIGRMDIAINNAGYDGEFQLTQDYSTEMLDHMIAVPTFAQVSAISVAGSIPGSSTRRAAEMRPFLYGSMVSGSAAESASISQGPTARNRPQGPRPHPRGYPPEGHLGRTR